MARRTHAGLAGWALAGVLVAGCGGDSSGTDPHIPDPHLYEVELLTDPFEHPWGLAFLADGSMLVTERPGRLSRVDGATHARTAIDGVPAVAAEGQGGLLDVAIHPSGGAEPWVYLTYAAEDEGGYTTHVGRGRLVGDALENFEVLHVATPFLSGGQHFGSRMVFGDDGMLYVTVGDRGSRDLAQDLEAHAGSTLRLTPEGEVPADNPFAGEADALPAIYSYGHRNSQGMVVHPDTGRIWQHEHGPSGGDEINIVEAGSNYGWPLASYGREYHDGSPIGGDPHDVEGTVPPIHWWEDSFAPSGMAFYEGDAFPRWRGNLFLGSLVQRHLLRLVMDGERVVSEERLIDDRSWRIRDVREGPDGYLYILIDAADAPLVRITPAD
jgi:aldose sugar dehydrogenase